MPPGLSLPEACAAVSISATDSQPSCSARCEASGEVPGPEVLDLDRRPAQVARRVSHQRHRAVGGLAGAGGDRHQFPGGGGLRQGQYIARVPVASAGSVPRQRIGPAPGTSTTRRGRSGVAPPSAAGSGFTIAGHAHAQTTASHSRQPVPGTGGLGHRRQGQTRARGAV